MIKAHGFAARAAGAALTPFSFDRRDLGPRDLALAVDYCGLCHSDLHMIDNDWGIAMFPLVPGHEIVGRVVAIGPEVSRFAVGDRVGVGCMTDSCGACRYCADGLEQYCDEYATPSFNAFERGADRIVHGGFSSHYVIREDFALRIPAGLDPARAAPLLCGGITTYSPLRHWKVGPGTRLGIVGLGGLGHLATKFGKALGAHVTIFTTSAAKEDDARRLGADAVVRSAADGLAGLAPDFDMIVDTVSGDHDVAAFVGLLRVDGILCMLGAPGEPIRLPATMLEIRRRAVVGSVMGGIAETQEMLDFCADKGLMAEVELLPVARINEALERLRRNDVRYRFVLDMAELAARDGG